MYYPIVLGCNTGFVWLIWWGAEEDCTKLSDCGWYVYVTFRKIQIIQLWNNTLENTSASYKRIITSSYIGQTNPMYFRNTGQHDYMQEIWPERSFIVPWSWILIILLITDRFFMIMFILWFMEVQECSLTFSAQKTRISYISSAPAYPRQLLQFFWIEQSIPTELTPGLFCILQAFTFLTLLGLQQLLTAAYIFDTRTYFGSRLKPQLH